MRYFYIEELVGTVIHTIMKWRDNIRTSAILPYADGQGLADATLLPELSSLSRHL